MDHPDVRHAVPDDLTRLVALWVDLGKEGTTADARYRVGVEGAQIAERIVREQWLGSPDWTVVVADHAHDGVVGFMAARPAAPHVVLEQPPTLVVTDAYVAAEHRRRGVARRLFEELARRVDPDEVIEVGTLALDTRAVAFWTAMGFGGWRVTLRRDPSVAGA